MSHPSKYVFPLLVLLLLPVMVFPAGKDSIETALTIYNENLALVRQWRALALTEGRQVFSYDGVASEIDPTSVHFRAPGVEVLEQNYEYDLVDNRTLLRKYIGEEVEVRLRDEGMFSGTLLADREPIMIRSDRGEVRTFNMEYVLGLNFPRLPEGLILVPTLRWDLLADKEGEVPGELSYLTRGIRWEASYVAILNENDDGLDFAGWVQIDNNSGATYEDAGLKLMAGDVRIEKEWRGRKYRDLDMVAMTAKADAGGFEEKGFFEYHLYELQRTTTIRDRQKKQIALFEPAFSKAKKVYTYKHWIDETKVSVAMEFVNSKENQLGIPLPKGKVRLMKRDTDGALEFIGEDRIDHTPKNEKVRLKTGKSFDLVVERTVTDQKRSGSVSETTVELEVRSSKKELVEVIVQERFYPNWSIEEESIRGRKVDAYTYEWSVPVPAEGSIMLGYRYKNW